MIKFIVTLMLVLSFACYAYADIDISTDQRSLFFGLMQLGEEKELAQFGTYHNQITCSSANGNTWYLKINVLQPLNAGLKEVIPLESFKWQLAWTNGKGTVANPHQFREFSLIPDTVYISGPGEAGGSSINLQFKYYLEIPQNQISGVYNTTIRFTLTEVY